MTVERLSVPDALEGIDWEVEAESKIEIRIRQHKPAIGEIYRECDVVNFILRRQNLA